MVDFAALADRFMAAYNAKDFDTMRDMLAPDVDMAHHNRGFTCNNRDDLMAVFPIFADVLAPDRKFSAPERVIVSGNIVVRESDYSGTATDDIPNFASKGEHFKFRLCSVFRFDDNGIIVEWKDHG